MECRHHGVQPDNYGERKCWVSHFVEIGIGQVRDLGTASVQLDEGRPFSSSALIFTEQGHPVSGGIRGAHTSGVVTGPLSARGGGTVTVTSTPSKAVSL